MKEYLHYLHQLSQEIPDFIHLYETKLRNGKTKDTDKLKKLNQILEHLKKLASLLENIDKSSLPQIHTLISTTLQQANEEKIYNALRRMNLKEFMDWLMKYPFHLANLRNEIISLHDCINDYQLFKKINTISQENIKELQSITSSWISDSSNLLFASDEEYNLQIKEIEKHRNTLKVLILKENEAIKTILPKKEKTVYFLEKKDAIKLIQQYLNQDSEILTPVKDEYINIIDTHLSIIGGSDKTNLDTLIEERKEIIRDAENRLSSFREETLSIIDKLRSAKIDWEIKNQSFASKVEESKRKIIDLKNDLNAIQQNIQNHTDKMLAIIGTNESDKKHPLPPDINQPIEPLANSIRTYREKSHLIDIAHAELNHLINSHVNAEDYRFTNLLTRHQKSLNCPYFSLNYTTQQKIKLTDDEHQGVIDQLNNILIQSKSDIHQTHHNISAKLKLVKSLECQILTTYKKSYSAINNDLFDDIKQKLITSEDFTSLDCHRLAAMEKSDLIDTFINSIKNANHLEELMNALKSDPSNASGLSLRQNTGLSKVFGISMGGFIYGLFHHRCKSTCDEYASKLKNMAEELIHEKIEGLRERNVNLAI